MSSAGFNVSVAIFILMEQKPNILGFVVFFTVHAALNEQSLREATHWLCQRDPVLAGVFRRHGYPALYARDPGFGTLVHIILEQQVSLASANAAFARLCVLTGTLTPQAVLAMDTDTFRSIGISRQKSGYIQHLADSVLQGRIALERLGYLSDEEAREALVGLKGIGLWTADIYLSECLLRPDILPKGDIGMLEAVKVLYQLDGRPDHDTFVAITSHWRPWRSVGTRMLWLHYLNN